MSAIDNSEALRGLFKERFGITLYEFDELPEDVQREVERISGEEKRNYLYTRKLIRVEKSCEVAGKTVISPSLVSILGGKTDVET
jgi:hypothetical protein